MGLGPHAWLRLTPGELYAIAATKREEDEAQWLKVAWLASTIPSQVGVLWQKSPKAKSAYDLAPWLPRPPEPVLTPEQAEQRAAAFWAQFGEVQRAH